MDPRSEIIRPLPGSITVEAEANLRVLCARGELDSAVVQAFRDRQGREPLVVDAIDGWVHTGSRPTATELTQLFAAQPGALDLDYRPAAWPAR